MTTYTTTLNLSPPAPSMIATVRPDSDDGTPCDIQLQSATDSGFTTVIATTTLLAQADGVAVSMGMGPFAPGTTIYVRARCGASGTWSAYTSTLTVAIPIGTGDAACYIDENVGVLLVLTGDQVDYIYENIGVLLVLGTEGLTYLYEGDVNADPPLPKIWAIFPGAGRVGDGVTIWGIGFGATQATWLGSIEMFIDGEWTAVSVTAWVLTPASAHAYDDERKIVPSTPHIDPEHNEVEIVIPGLAIPPGHGVRVHLER